MTVSIHEHEFVVAERDALRREVDALRREAGRMVAEAGEVMREAAQNACTSRSIGTDHDDFDEWDYCNYGCADAIRALPAITIDDLKGGA